MNANIAFILLQRHIRPIFLSVIHRDIHKVKGVRCECCVGGGVQRHATGD